MIRAATGVLSLALLLAARPVAAQTNHPATESDVVLRIQNSTLFGGSPRGEPATLQNIVGFLRKEHPDVNFVLAPELAEVRVNDVLLHNAGLNDEMEALSVASGDMFLVDNTASTSGRPLMKLISSPHMRSASSDNNVQAFNLTGYFESKAATNSNPGQYIDALQEAISQTLYSMNLNNAPLRFYFHPGSNLLVVSGNREAVSVAQKIVTAFCGGPRPETAVAADAGDEKIRRLEDQVAMLEAEIARLKAAGTPATNH